MCGFQVSTGLSATRSSSPSNDVLATEVRRREGQGKGRWGTVISEESEWEGETAQILKSIKGR